MRTPPTPLWTSQLFSPDSFIHAVSFSCSSGSPQSLMDSHGAIPIHQLHHIVALLWRKQWMVEQAGKEMVLHSPALLKRLLAGLFIFSSQALKSALWLLYVILVALPFSSLALFCVGFRVNAVCNFISSIPQTLSDTPDVAFFCCA